MKRLLFEPVNNNQRIRNAEKAKKYDTDLLKKGVEHWHESIFVLRNQLFHRIS